MPGCSSAQAGGGDFGRSVPGDLIGSLGTTGSNYRRADTVRCGERARVLALSAGARAQATRQGTRLDIQAEGCHVACRCLGAGGALPSRVTTTGFDVAPCS